MLLLNSCSLFFFFNDTATTEIYTLSLHDALPISLLRGREDETARPSSRRPRRGWWSPRWTRRSRSEEHTSELQSLRHLVCRLLLEKKKQAPSSQCRSLANPLSRPWARPIL